MPKQRQRIVQLVEGNYRELEPGRFRNQAEGRPGDQTQCTLGTNEQLFQVIARIIFVKICIQIKYLSLWRNYLKSQNLFPRHSVFDDLVTAGVG